MYKNDSERKPLMGQDTPHAEAGMARSVFGQQGRAIGLLRRDPSAYPCRDGSVTFLLQVDVQQWGSAPPGGQADQPLLLRFHVPAMLIPYSPLVWLRQGHRVNVGYVTRTDFYQTAEGTPTSKTYLELEDLTRISCSAPARRQQGGQSGYRRDRASPGKYARRGAPGREVGGYVSGKDRLRDAV